jgi:hypothetical protein
MINLLIDDSQADDYLMKTNKEFLEFSEDFSMRPWYLHPYAQTSLLINECVNLSMIIAGGNIKLIEPPGGRKDRYTSVSYMNYFAHLLDQNLLKEYSNDEQKFLSLTLIG